MCICIINVFLCFVPLCLWVLNTDQLNHQVSGDEQRQLCGERTKLSASTGCIGGSQDAASSLPLGISLATYGSVAYQLKDANMEASGTCDFVCRAMRIVNKTGKMLFFNLNPSKNNTDHPGYRDVSKPPLIKNHTCVFC